MKTFCFLAVLVAAVSAAPGGSYSSLPGYGSGMTAYPHYGYPYNPYERYHPKVTKEQPKGKDDEYNTNYDASQSTSDNENATANDNLAGAKSENANENANMAKGGEAFGFGALESDNRNLLANENNIEVANANKNELGVEVANFNANENSAEQESASVAEVTNEDDALFADFLDNDTDSLNLNDNVNDRLADYGIGCGCN